MTPATVRDVPRLEGIEVAHFQRSNAGNHDEYGGRCRPGDTLRHARNTDPGERGWLGNPYVAPDDHPVSRQTAIAAWASYFLRRVERDAEFREAVEDLRGDRVACWCRGVTQERTPETWCHLDVVDAYLQGDLTPVYDYLKRDL